MGHLGLGYQLSRPIRTLKNNRQFVALCLGTLLPDILDKTLYYTLSWSTGLTGADLGLISGTRTFGHTLLLWFLLGFVASRFKRDWLLWIVIGAFTHLFLDQLWDYVDYLFLSVQGNPVPLDFSIHSPRITGTFWPFLGNQFLIMPTHSLSEHLSKFGRLSFVLGEILGLFCFMPKFLRVFRAGGVWNTPRSSK